MLGGMLRRLLQVAEDGHLVAVYNSSELVSGQLGFWCLHDADDLCILGADAHVVNDDLAAALDCAPNLAMSDLLWPVPAVQAA